MLKIELLTFYPSSTWMILRVETLMIFNIFNHASKIHFYLPTLAWLNLSIFYIYVDIIEFMLQLMQQHLPLSIDWLSSFGHAAAVIKKSLVSKDTQTSTYICEVVSLVLSTTDSGILRESLLEAQYFGTFYRINLLHFILL